MATDSVRFDASPRTLVYPFPLEAEPEGAIEAKAAGTDATTADRPAVMSSTAVPPPIPGFMPWPPSRRSVTMKKDTREVGATQVTVGELDLARVGVASSTTSTRRRVPSKPGSATRAKEFGVQAAARHSPGTAVPNRSIRWILLAIIATTSTGRHDLQHVQNGLWRPDRLCAQADDVDGRHASRVRLAGLCDDRFMTPVMPNGSFVRQDGSSQTFSGSFSIAGFGGGMTSLNSKSVRHEWKNGDAHHSRTSAECPERLTKDTRVVALS